MGIHDGAQALQGEKEDEMERWRDGEREERKRGGNKKRKKGVT